MFKMQRRNALRAFIGGGVDLYHGQGKKKGSKCRKNEELSIIALPRKNENCRYGSDPTAQYGSGSHCTPESGSGSGSDLKKSD